MLTDDDWKVLVEAIRSATESGDLQWELLGDDPLELQEKGTSLRFESRFDTNARIELFGRFRGFSYNAEIYREGTEGYDFEDSITVRSKANSRGIPFDVLFRTVRAQARESRQRALDGNRDRWFAWAINCLELLPGHEHDPWDWEADSPDDWMAELTDDQWDSLVSKVIACTESKTLEWTQDGQTDSARDYRTFEAYIDDDFRLHFGLDGQSFELWIADPQHIEAREEFGVISEYSGGRLERLGEVIGATSRRQFQQIVKDDALQGFLKGLGKK